MFQVGVNFLAKHPAALDRLKWQPAIFRVVCEV
jgi:hypothetical protein